MLLEKKCLYCNKKFKRQISPSNIKAGKGKFCSINCSAKYSSEKYKNGDSNIKVENLKLGRYCGKKVSKSTRNKISKSLLGKKGNLSRNWKGGITPLNKLIRESHLIKNWRKKIFKRDDYTCQICGERGCKLNAHHIKKFSDYKKLRYRSDNGITLCTVCHKLVTWDEVSWEPYFLFNLETRFGGRD